MKPILKTALAASMDMGDSFHATCPWCQAPMRCVRSLDNIYEHTCSEHFHEITYVVNGTVITGIRQYLQSERLSVTKPIHYKIKPPDPEPTPGLDGAGI